jgi:Uma2 family endonuclease
MVAIGDKVNPSQEWTDAQVMGSGAPGRTELVDGRLIVSPAGFDHGYACALILAQLTVFVRANKLGKVVDSSTGFRLPSGDVLSPDVGFVRTARLRSAASETRSFFRGAPDVAIEVLSPFDRQSEVQRKIEQLLANGCSAVWLVDPERRIGWVYSAQCIAEIGANKHFESADFLPGFRMNLAELLDDSPGKT